MGAAQKIGLKIHMYKYMCIYIYMCVCVCMCMYVDIFMRIYLNTYLEPPQAIISVVIAKGGKFPRCSQKTALL